MDAERARQETVEAYEAYGSAVLGYALRLTHNDALAQDALQETYLRFFLALMHDEPIRNCRAWLHRVAHNYICDTVRAAAERTSVSLEEIGGDVVEDRGSQPAAQFVDWFQGLRQTLAPRELQCIELRAEGLDYTEIAAKLSLRPGTVGALLHRAAEKLRNRLHKRGAPE